MHRRSLLCHARHGFLALLSVLTFLGTQYASAVDPTVKWETLETPHFVIHHDSRHYSLAFSYARYAEEAYAATTPFFKEAPEKTVLVIDDSTDLANGFAMALAYPLVTAFPVLPVVTDSIADYGDWGFELMTHEYTHILTFEPANGIARPLRWIFGSVLRPNATLPRWYLEGLAVQMETRLSKHGRLRSRNAMALPRALVEEDKLNQEDVARINEGIPDALGGQRPYLLGGILWNHMVDVGGDQIVGELNDDYSRRLPFLIDTPVRRRLGLDYEGLLARTYARVNERASAQIYSVKEAGELRSKALEPQEGVFNHSPITSPDGRYLAFISRTLDRDDRIEVLERGDGKASFAEGKREILGSGISVNRVAWFPDSTAVVHDKVEVFERFYQYSDLYRIDIDSKKVTRLTTGLRAREPVVSPDGTRIFFVQVTPGSTQLSSVDSRGKNLRPVYVPSAPGTRISRPEFLSRDRLIFAEKDAEGFDVFRVLTLGSDDAPTTVLDAFKPVAFPRMTSEGLLFVSGRSGIDNIYLADAQLKNARPVSNVTTRALTGEIDPRTRELWFSRLSASGPRIHVAEVDAWQETRLRPPRIGPLLETDWPEFVRPTVEIEPQRKPYSSWDYMLPTYWIPFLYVIPGGAYVSANTGATDPLGRHSYSVDASYDTLSQKPSIGAEYVNRQTQVTYGVSAADVNEYIFSGDFVRHTTTAGLSATFVLPKMISNWRATLGGRWTQTELPNRMDTRAGPSLAVEYSNAVQRGEEISPSRGGAATISHTRFLPELGNIDYEATTILARGFWSRWLPKRHAFSLSVNAFLAPRLQNIFLGQPTAAGNYAGLLIANDFMMRGYANGGFIGRQIVTTNLEYRFPIWDAFFGLNTWPAFLQRVHGAVFLDSATLDGAWFDIEGERYRRARMGRFYTGTGIEARADLTVFYNMPVRFTAGLYYGMHDRAGLGFAPFFGFTF